MPSKFTSQLYEPDDLNEYETEPVIG